MEKHEKPLSLHLFDYISELDYKRLSVAIVKSSLSANPGEKITAFQKFSSRRLIDTQEWNKHCREVLTMRATKMRPVSLANALF